MNWIDIEAKWTAMTRRVQSDRLPNDSAILASDAQSQSPLLPEVMDQRPAPSDRPGT